MNKPIVERIEELRVLNADLRRQLELAEAVIPELNDLIRRLAATGLLRHHALIGDIVHQRPYVPGCGPVDSGQVYIAAIVLPDGLGAAVIDSEQCVGGIADLVADLNIYFVPFDRCEPVIQSLLLSHVGPLLNEFCALVVPVIHK